MRIFILLIILIASGAQAKKQKHIDIYIAPAPFGAMLLKPFNVDLNYPIPHLNYDPDRGKIVIKGKKYKDRAIGVVDEEVILLSDTHMHSLTLHMILNHAPTPGDVFSDIINIKTQKAIAIINKIRSYSYELNAYMTPFLEQGEIPKPNKIFKNLKLYKENFINFLSDTITVDKFHEKLIVPKLPLTDANIYDFSKFSNNQHFFCTDLYTAAIITMTRRSFDLLDAKTLYISLFENDLLNLRKKFGDGKRGAEFKLSLIFIDPNIRKYRNIGLNVNLNKKLIGPLRDGRKLTYIKFLKKERKYNMGELDFKLRNCFIKKKIKANTKMSMYEKRSEITALEKIREKLIKNKKINDSICKDEWVTDLDISLTARLQLSMLEKNDVSKIFEDSDGWRVARILEKNLTRNSYAYARIYEVYRNEQLFLFLESYLKVLRRQAYKIIYK